MLEYQWDGIAIVLYGVLVHIYNKKYNFCFNHESPGHADLYLSEKWKYGKNHFTINNYQNLKKRYSDRINNFIQYLSDPSNIITFIITTWNKNDDDMHVLKDILNIKYPNLKYNFIILNDPNGKENFIKNLIYMRFTANDEELKRLL